MAKNLLDAFFADLREQKFQGQDELKTYLRWLVSEVYLKKQRDDTNTHRYISYKKEKNEDILKELQSLSYHSEKYLSYEDFINAITNSVFNEYLNQEKNNINSFDEVMLKALTYYEKKFNKYDKNSVINFTRIILKDYIINNNVRVFSSKNGTRQYVLDNGMQNIINEISARVKNYDSIYVVIDNYSTMIADYYMSLNNNINLEDEITNQIFNLNVNDNLKKYLLNEFSIGNLSALLGYVNEDLLNQYKQTLSTDDKKHLI